MLSENGTSLLSFSIKYYQCNSACPNLRQSIRCQLLSINGKYKQNLHFYLVVQLSACIPVQAPVLQTLAHVISFVEQRCWPQTRQDPKEDWTVTWMKTSKAIVILTQRLLGHESVIPWYLNQSLIMRNYGEIFKEGWIPYFCPLSSSLWRMWRSLLSEMGHWIRWTTGDISYVQNELFMWLVCKCSQDFNSRWLLRNTSIHLLLVCNWKLWHEWT